MGVRGPAPAAAAEDAVRLRMVIMRLARWAGRTRAGSALSATQTMVLATIVHRSPIGPSELARLEALNPTMLSRILRRLEDEGLVARQEDPEDRRAVRLAATAEGRRLNERIRRARADELAHVLENLDEAARAALTEALPALESLADELKEKRR